jgi:hypothetical protein
MTGKREERGIMALDLLRICILQKGRCSSEQYINVELISFTLNHGNQRLAFFASFHKITQLRLQGN